MLPILVICSNPGRKLTFTRLRDQTSTLPQMASSWQVWSIGYSGNLRFIWIKMRLVTFLIICCTEIDDRISIQIPLISTGRGQFDWESYCLLERMKQMLSSEVWLNLGLTLPIPDSSELMRALQRC